MGNEWLPLAGLVVGVLVGLTGMGGGVLMTPLLLAIGLPPTVAVGTDLAYSMPTKMVGEWQHWRQGTVDGRVIRGLAMGSLPAAAPAVAILAQLRIAHQEQVEYWLKPLIGVMLLVAAILLLNRVLRGQDMHAGSGAGEGPAVYSLPKLLAIGAFGGFVVGLTSIGSGSLIIALLVMTVSLRPEKLVGTDVAHAFLLVSVAAFGHLLVLDTVDLSLAGRLLAGSIPGVLIGSRLTLWVPRRPLQIGLAGLLLSTAYGLLRLPLPW
jgi:uncharacterized membrane protein YfcA